MWAWIATGAAALPAIVGGDAVDDPLDPVVALVGDAGVVCSGILVHPEWVLTAGHCVDTEPTEVWWGTDLRGGSPAQARAIDDALVHPERLDREYDVGLVHLDAPANGAYGQLAEGPPEVGDVVTALGFGATNDGADDGGVKRAVDLDVLDVEDVLVRTYRGGANVCSGDSGGPLIRPESTFEVVAVVGFVDPTCLGGTGGGTRADTIRAFVDEVVPPLPERPDTGVEVEDGSGTPEPRCGCRSSALNPGWPVLAVFLSRRRGGRARPTRGKSSAP